MNMLQIAIALTATSVVAGLICVRYSRGPKAMACVGFLASASGIAWIASDTLGVALELTLIPIVCLTFVASFSEFYQPPADEPAPV